MVGAERFLEILVDKEVVYSVYLIRLEEGIVAYWPPEALDDEAVNVGEALSVPLNPGLYFIVGGDKLNHRYIGLVVGKGLLLFRVGERVPLEKFAAKLSQTYTLFLTNRVQRARDRMVNMINISDEKRPNGGIP